LHQNQYESISQAKGTALDAGHHQPKPTPIDLSRPDLSGIKREDVVVTELRFFTVPEIADLLQMKRERVYEAVRLGLVPAVHIGRQIRIEQKAFVEWVRDGGQTCAAGWRHQAS
jgi:excisionase family DNA binding protein